MIAGIILAAGEGRRIKKDKLILPLGSRVVIEWVLEAATKSALDKIFLVVKRSDEKIIEAGKKYGVTIVYNPDHKEGMSSSIKHALTVLENDKVISGFCVLLGDQPFIETTTINQLIKKFQQGQKEIVIPYFHGKAGNPVLFDISWKEEFMRIKGDMGGRVLIKAFPDKIKRVFVKDKSILFDIDKEEDYLKAKTLIAKKEKE